MATGYTSQIDKDTTAEKFAIICLGNFVYALSEAVPNGWPEPFDVLEYYRERVRNAEKRLSELREMTEGQYIAWSQAEEEKEREYRQKQNAEKDELKNTLEKLLAEVELWSPPPGESFSRFKSFMVSQIKETISFDCQRSAYLKREQRFIAEEIAYADLERARCEKALREMAHKVATDNVFVKELKQSFAKKEGEDRDA